MKEREAVKLRQAEAMHEVLKAAERLAKEQKKVRRKCEESDEETTISSRECESKISNEAQVKQNCSSARTSSSDVKDTNEIVTLLNDKENNDNKDVASSSEKAEQEKNDLRAVQVPISKDVAIVLSGRLEDSEILNKANLQLVNLVLTPTPRTIENNSNNLSVGLNTFIHNLGSSNFSPNSSRIPSTIVENRLLTPSKYRSMNGRDFGTQTDIENDRQDYREKFQDSSIKDSSMKDRKDATNASKRDIEK